MIKSFTFKLFLGLTLLAALAGGSLVASAAGATPTFEGSYDWLNGGRDTLRVEFKPDGANSWRVDFKFEFNGKRNTWKGTAEGALDDGSQLSGTASWRNRQWRWSAEIVDGVMRGRHTELRSRGRTRATGTFEVRRD